MSNASPPPPPTPPWWYRFREALPLLVVSLGALLAATGVYVWWVA